MVHIVYFPGGEEDKIEKIRSEKSVNKQNKGNKTNRFKLTKRSKQTKKPTNKTARPAAAQDPDDCSYPITATSTIYDNCTKDDPVSVGA